MPGPIDHSSLIRRAGEALYGPRWETDLARDLGVSDRTARKWDSGDQQPRPGVYTDLHRLLLERAAEIDALLPQIADAATP